MSNKWIYYQTIVPLSKDPWGSSNSTWSTQLQSIERGGRSGREGGRKKQESGGLGGQWLPLPPYITKGAPGLASIVYIEWLFSRPQWLTNYLPTNQMKINKKLRSNQPGLNVIILRQKKRTALWSWKLQCPIWQDRKTKETMVMSHKYGQRLLTYTGRLMLNSKTPHCHIRAEYGFRAKSDDGWTHLIHPTNTVWARAYGKQKSNFYPDKHVPEAGFSRLKQSIPAKSERSGHCIFGASQLTQQKWERRGGLLDETICRSVG